MNDEEILKDISNYISFSNKAENFSDINEYLHSKELARRFQGLLDLYKAEKEKSKELAKALKVMGTNPDLTENEIIELFTNNPITDDYIEKFSNQYISKDKIKTKIEKLDKRKRENQSNYSTLDELIIDKEIQVLQELLEKEG